MLVNIFCYSIFRSIIMQWSDPKDILLMREVASVGVFTFKSGSRERGNAWQFVATNLNATEGFNVTARAVRDRMTSLMKKYSAQNNTERQASGLGGSEPSEIDTLLQDLVDINADSELKKDNEKALKINNINEEKQKAINIRATAMETLSETKKRKEEEEPKEKRMRRSSGDTLSFLKEKIEMDREIKNRELELNSNRQNEFQQMIQQQERNSNNMMQLFMEQSQRQQEQFQAMMAQNQLQTIALIDVLKKN